jgi:hypothetical protein
MVSINRAEQSFTILGDDVLVGLQSIAQIYTGKDSLLDFTVNDSAKGAYTVVIQLSKPGILSDGTRVCGLVTELKINETIRVGPPFECHTFFLDKSSFIALAKRYDAARKDD